MSAIISNLFVTVLIAFLFIHRCPKTVENFCVHSRNGYYNGHLIHRVIKGFMIQMGDPLGKGPAKIAQVVQPRACRCQALGFKPKAGHLKLLIVCRIKHKTEDRA